MPTNSMTERNQGAMENREDMRSSERYLKPAVNIVETDEGIMLTADVPGATKDQLQINVDQGILTISAPATTTLPGTPIYKEFELATYYRQFSIPEVLDHSKARADLNNGILTLRIPKAEVAKPKKIEISVE